LGTGTTAIAPTGRLNIQGADQKTLFERSLTAAGTALFTGPGPLRIEGFSQLTNLAGATFTAQGDVQILSETPGTFTNKGRCVKSAAGVAAVASAFNNQGTADVQAGRLSLSGGGSNTGPYNISAGAVLEFADGIHELSANANLTGAGLAQITGAIVNVSGNA